MTATTPPANGALTALLGERFRTAMPGYTVALTPHPAALAGDGRQHPAVVVMMGTPHLEAVLWVQDTVGEAADWAGRSVQVRVVLWSAFDTDRIVEMIDGAIEFDPPLPPVDEILDLLVEMIDVDLRAVAEDLDDADAATLRDGLRIYHNDPPHRD